MIVNVLDELVDAAAEAGADLVKFQTFSAEALVAKDAPKADYQKRLTAGDEKQFGMLKRLELSPANHRALMDQCRERGIGFFSTGFDLASLVFFGRVGIHPPQGALRRDHELPLPAQDGFIRQGSAAIDRHG